MTDPRTLSKRDRQACVDVRTSEGYCAPEIASICECHDRTIRRDREEIRESRSLQFDAALTGMIAGQLMHELQAVVERVRRAARSPDARARDKIMGEFVVMDAWVAVVHLLQQLGYVSRVSPRWSSNFDSVSDHVAKHALERAHRDGVVTHSDKQMQEEITRMMGGSGGVEWGESPGLSSG